MKAAASSRCGTAEDIVLSPANDYVADFVEHMNPLNVLRGTSVMTPASQLRRDRERGADRLRRDPRRASTPRSGRSASRSPAAQGSLANADGETGTIADQTCDMIVAPVDLKLRAAIALQQQTGNPIVLVDQLGRLAGLCGDEEIYRGLLRRQ